MGEGRNSKTTFGGRGCGSGRVPARVMRDNVVKKEIDMKPQSMFPSKSKVDLFCGDCLEAMQNIPDGSVDLTVTSPPYDNLRTYNDKLVWNWDIFTGIAEQLFRVTKKGGVVIWVVGDATINGSETGTSFKQALYFKEIGFNLHQTIIYQKTGGQIGSLKAYYKRTEYMFVISKSMVKTFNPICDVKTVKSGKTYKGGGGMQKNGKIAQTVSLTSSQYGKRTNIWKYDPANASKMLNNINAPAPFPEKLAHDHIISWSNEGDTVLDPMMGSGTTGKMAKLLNRDFIGIEKKKEYFEIAVNRIG